MVSSMHGPFIYYPMSFEKHVVSTRAADLEQLYKLRNGMTDWEDGGINVDSCLQVYIKASQAANGVF